MNASKEKVCVIFLNMGGPEDLSQVREFLYNIFSDRSIIQLPGGKTFQKPFARMISKFRAKKVQKRYEQIGGGSPLLHWSKIQAEQVENLLKSRFEGIKCMVGMRYLPPYIQEPISEAYDNGYRRMVFVPLYPHYCRATTGTAFEQVKIALANYPDIEALFVSDYHDDPGYTSLLHKYIIDNIPENANLLFSAHALPEKFVLEGDPYVAQIRRTVEIAAKGMEFYISFQSRTGPVKWVEPDTIEMTRQLLSKSDSDLFIVPISFVSDHIETLYEIDVELKELMGENGNRIKRMPMFNGDEKFSAALSYLIAEKCKKNGWL